MSEGQQRVVDTVAAVFPGAMKGSAVMSKIMHVLRPYGYKRSNTLFGHSICSDEISKGRGHLPALLTKYYGRAFTLGGLGGTPHVGRTGFAAFSQHVPENGHIMLVFGPHVGFSPDGEPGKFLRKGQAVLSSSSDAVFAAYSQLASGRNFPADASDMQQAWLRSKLKTAMPALQKSLLPMVDLYYEVYKLIEEEVMALANTDFGPGNLVLLGGIMISMPDSLPGYFVPMHFSIRSQNLFPKDLLPSLRS